VLGRSKAKKWINIRWDITFRRRFALRNEDEQINKLADIGRTMHKLAWTPVPLDFNDETREYYATGILEQIEKSFTWTST
jgi:hypothetical protein